MYVYRCDICADITPTIVLRNTAEVPSCMHSRDGKTAEAVPMVRVPDTAQVLLSMDLGHAGKLPPAHNVLAPAKVEHLKAVGILLPETQHALDWMYRHRATNGMADAFCKVGGRRCIDLVAFARLMREQRA